MRGGAAPAGEVGETRAQRNVPVVPWFENPMDIMIRYDQIGLTAAAVAKKPATTTESPYAI